MTDEEMQKGPGPGESATPTDEPELLDLMGRRPPPLTFFCAIAFVGFPLFLFELLNPKAVHAVSEGYRFSLEKAQAVANGRLIVYVGMLFGFIGLWKMKRWGLVLLTVAWLGSLGVEMYFGILQTDLVRYGPAYLIGQGKVLIPIIFAAFFWRMMSWK